jgi:hypothetical protein
MLMNWDRHVSMVNPTNERSAVSTHRLRLVNSVGQRSLSRYLDILLDAIKATLSISFRLSSTNLATRARSASLN